MAVAKKSASVDDSEPARPNGPIADFSKDQDLAAYKTMLTIRRFEEKAGQMYGMGLIGGFCHLYIGQEAVVVGMQMALKDGDQVITGYRDHGHMIACGMEPKGVMAELTGRAHGYSRGKGGSMHMFSVEKGFYGGHGIVGAQVPLGTGLAFAARLSRASGARACRYWSISTMRAAGWADSTSSNCSISPAGQAGFSTSTHAAGFLASTERTARR